GLIEALLRHGTGLLADRLLVAERTEDVADALAALVDGTLGFFAEYPAFAQLLVGELWRTTGQWQESLAVLRDDIVSVIRAQITRIADAGRLPEGARIDTASAALFGTLLVVALDWQVFKPERGQQEVRDSV